MRNVRINRTVTLLCALLIAASVRADSALSEHPEVAGALGVIDAWVAATRAYDEIPGVSVGIVHDQDLIFARGYGYANPQADIPADADTIYSVCSISKLFTSIAVMQMRDQDKLTLRDPVTQHLPWAEAIQQQHAEAGPARIVGLLTHSSGLPREADFPYWGGDFPFPERAAMIERLAEQATLYPSDTLFQYSNLGLTLAGEIAAHHGGAPYADYVRSAILDPLAMADTRPFFPVDLHGKQMAVGYAGKFRQRDRKPVKPFDTRAIAPAAGFTSTVNDLARFASWQFRTLDGEANAVLAPNTLREMHRVHWVDPDWKTTWGIGFVVTEQNGTSVVGHGGGCPGYITQFALVPKYKLGVIVLTNAADGPAGRLTGGIMKTVGAALAKAGKAAEATAQADAAGDSDEDAPADLETFAGNFGGTVWGGEVAVRVWGDQLAAVRLPADNLDEITRLKREEGDTFVRVTDDGEEREAWRFERDAQGRVAAFWRHSMRIPRI